MNTGAIVNWKVLQARQSQNLLGREVADRCGCSVGMYYNVENLQRRPSRRLAENIASMLGLDAEDVWPTWAGIGIRKSKNKQVDGLRLTPISETLFSDLTPERRRELKNVRADTQRENLAAEIIRDAARYLNDKDREIFLSHGLGRETMISLAKRLNITRTRVYQIYQRAQRKMCQVIEQNCLWQ